MIGFFADPYPDELLFSVCSRYHERTGYRSRECTGRDLFAAVRAIVAVGLPCKLDKLAEALPHGHRYTSDQFIDENTLLPFYGPFVPPERLPLLRKDMRGGSGGAIYGRLGVLTSKIDAEFLRFCPACVESDREQFGETYWHRIHNVPGVEVCPAHLVWLENSEVYVRRRGGNKDHFVTAEQSVRRVSAHPIGNGERQDRARLRIAEDAAWLLRTCGITADPTLHRERYIGLLFDRGISTYRGVVNTPELINSLTAHYSYEFLHGIGCGTGGRYNWIHRLVHNTGRAQHPLQHLLLMQFLGFTAERFFRLPAQRLPFGEGPWPCLNRASDHYRQNLIAQYELTFTQKGRKPRGIFRCCCGFAYYRVGPDRSAEARFEMSGCIAFGEVWGRALRQMHEEGGYTNEELAARLGVRPEIMRAKIAGLRLTATSEEAATERYDETTKIRAKIGRPKTVVDPTLLESNRKILSDEIAANPDLGRQGVYERVKTTFIWLRRHDREWLEAHLPARRTPKGPGVKIDWRARDAEFATAVRGEAERLFNAPGRPVRVTATGVAKRVGKLALVSKHGDKLPQTVEALKEVAETVEDYAVRRVLWAADCCRKEGLRLSPTLLQIRAAVSTKIAKSQVVKSAIDAAILKI